MSSHNLVFLHGWSTSPRVWEKQVDYFSEKYSVKAIDLYGRKSEVGSQKSGNLSSVLCPLSSVLIGWSYGGMCALEMAAAEPKKYKALILVGSSAKFSDGLRPIVIKNILRNLNRNYEVTMRDCCATFFSEQEKIFREKFMSEQVLPDKDITIQILKNLLNMNLKESLKKINIPTLIIHGDKDEVCPIAGGKFLNNGIADSRIAVIEDAGHAPFYTRPEEFNRILEEFLEALD